MPSAAPPRPGPQIAARRGYALRGLDGARRATAELRAVTRDFTRLKHRLMPYLFRAAQQAAERGTPVMRAMVIEFPDDPACHTLDRQYMLGDYLLVAPVFSADGEVEYYVPDGTWTHLLSGERIQGPGRRRERYGYDSMPLLARPGSVIPFGDSDDDAVYDWAHGVTLRVHAPVDGATAVTRIPAPDGPGSAKASTVAVFRARREGDAVTLEAEGAPGPWRVLLVGTEAELGEGSPASVSVERTGLGTLVGAPAGTTAVTALLTGS
ncbi:hypothetical protein [Streptomyces sp. NPDC001970]